MGNLSKLIKEMKKFKRYTDEELNKQIASLDKIRQIIKYNPQVFQPNFCRFCGKKL